MVPMSLCRFSCRSSGRIRHKPRTFSRKSVALEGTNMHPIRQTELASSTTEKLTLLFLAATPCVWLCRGCVGSGLFSLSLSLSWCATHGRSGS